MTRSVVWQLILKDLYLVRWMMLSSLVAGAAAVAVIPLGGFAAYVGGVSLICVLIILNIFLVMNSVVQERKDKVLLFVLSLPISTAQYIIAKVAATGIAFLVPWIVLCIATVVTIDWTAIPNGILPYWITILVYLLAYNSALTAVGLATDSSGWHATAITIGNVSLNFLIPILLSLHSVTAHRESPTAVWTGDILAIIALELAIGLGALAGAVYFKSRAGDFV
jgi:ABC-2 type transport system permease protein